MGQPKQKTITSELALSAEVEELSRGNSDAAYNLANDLRSAPKSELIGVLYQFSFERGVTEAALNYATYLEGRGDRQSALLWFEKAFQCGDRRAAVAIAQIYNSFGNPASALEWYRKGSDVGEGAVGYSRTARLLQHYDEATAALLRHADRDVEAATELVTQHRGLLSAGDARDLLQAHWDRRASDASAYSAGVPLGNLLAEEGETDLAISIYREAAERGDSHASFNLGLELLESDRTEAMRWIRRARKQGDKRAKKWLKKNG